MDNQHRKIRGVSGIYAIAGAGKTYIGSAVCLARRWKAHQQALRSGIHRNIHLQRAWDKHGEEAFTFSVLEIVADPSRLIECEQQWIDCTRDLYNLCPTAGSHLGAKRSEQTKQRMSAALKGRAPTAAAIEASRAYHLGRKQSPETVRRRSEAMKGKPRAPLSAEVRLKISEAQRGSTRVFTDKHRQKLSEAARGRKLSKEACAKISAAHQGQKRQFTEQHKANIKAAWAARKANA